MNFFLDVRGLVSLVLINKFPVSHFGKGWSRWLVPPG